MAIYKIEATIDMNIDEEVEKVFDSNGFVWEVKMIDMGRVFLTSDLWVQVVDRTDEKPTISTYEYTMSIPESAYDAVDGDLSQLDLDWNNADLEINRHGLLL